MFCNEFLTALHCMHHREIFNSDRHVSMMVSSKKLCLGESVVSFFPTLEVQGVLKAVCTRQAAEERAQENRLSGSSRDRTNI